MPSENIELRALVSRFFGTCLGAIELVSFVALLASYTHWTFGPFPKLISSKSFLTFLPQDAYPDDRIDLEDTAALYIQTQWNYTPSFPECDLPEDALFLFPPDFGSTSTHFRSSEE